MNYNEKNILFYDSFSILLLNPNGQLRRLYTPFRVTCINHIDNIRLNAVLFVDEVFEDQDDLLLFKIYGNLYA